MRWNQKKTVESVARAKGMRAEGLTIARIAQSIGVSQSAINMWINPKCHEASKASCRRYKRENREKVREWINGRNATPAGWATTAAIRCRRRALSIGVPCNITGQDVIDALPHDLCCPVFGTPLQFGRGTSQNNPSIDRIIPDRGYVKGNIAVISFRANTMKQDACVEDARKLLAYMEKEVSRVANTNK